MSPKTASLGDAADVLNDVVELGLKVGAGLLRAIRLPERSCGCSCRIPPPCWMPQPLGDVSGRVCPGNRAVLRVNVTNCGNSERTIEIEAANPKIKVEPPSLKLGRLEQRLVVLSLDVPPTATEGNVEKSLVWVRGCKEHYLRWTLEVACESATCCSDVDVEDCPDLVHHWYDHFYCETPCPQHR